ncbi:MAG: glutamate synthase large subunit [Proteobacteria bacterium]|nr:glutamate synthase large subunit [Pseudomonadota bacterium]
MQASDRGASVRQWRFEKSLLADPREEQRDACGVGIIAQIKGEKSHDIVCDGLEMLRRMDHRGGRAADNLTSDGAGILVQIPHNIIERSAVRQGKALPSSGKYAVAMCFLPQNKSEQDFWQQALEGVCRRYKLNLLFLRDVPVDLNVLGPVGRRTLPHFLQAVYTCADSSFDEKKFSERLFFFRKNLENIARARYGLQQREFYVASLSSENICYKALVTAQNLGAFYPDLQNPMFKSAYALVHLRFSTNTLPSWPLAQPLRTLCHNGEINTLRGNINAMHARTRLFEHKTQQASLDSMGPVCTPGMSDSAMLDNTVEFLLHSGRNLPHVMSMVVPEPWEKNQEMSQELKDYYEYQSYLMEPWDGPALIAFCSGSQAGAILDRNGLRPARYCITNDGHVVLASEAGVLPRRWENAVEKGRLSPGRLFLIDMKKGIIIPDQVIKSELAAQKPYGQWLNEHRLTLADVAAASAAESQPEVHSTAKESTAPLSTLESFGYTKEDLRIVLAPMANNAKEPDGSMGTDIPLAVLSSKRPLLYNYFKQLFAQVTNPPIDAIREEPVTSLTSYLGAEKNLLTEEPEHCSVIRLPRPVLTNAELASLSSCEKKQFEPHRIDITFDVKTESLEQALERISSDAGKAARSGRKVILLSDRNISERRAPIPALLATSSLHHALMRTGERARCSLIVESAEPREVHHFALLLGYGAAAVNPWLAFSLLQSAPVKFGLDESLSAEKLCSNYVKSVCDGLLKIMSKMGISTLHSYRGGQIFEALGLSQELVDKHFTWTSSKIGGITLSDIEDDVRFRHRRAFAGAKDDMSRQLETGGIYQWSTDGEQHLHSPEMIVSLQNSIRLNSREEFRKFCATVDEGSAHPLNLRSLLRFKKFQPSIALSEVEPVQAIVKRFSTGAMSFGSISKEAHETIAIAMNRIGARSNSGEGGEDPQRYLVNANGDSPRSAIKQVASARFGVTMSYLCNANELQIKMAQGAKPGEGGQLPGHKVDKAIARVRHSTAGITLISPPPHHDIYSIEDLAQLIHDLKNANSTARISVKLVSVAGIGTIAAGVAKAKAEVILVSGHEGGTGASPISSIRHAGMPWELGLAETHRTLVETHLRGRVVLQADGQLRTPRDIAIATLLGAEEWGLATGALISLGCIMMRKCHLNTCPVGIATQDPELRKKFAGQPEGLINYIFLLAEGLREIMAELGFKTVEDMVGRAEALQKNPEIADPRIKKIDLSALLNLPNAPLTLLRNKGEKQSHGIEENIDSTKIIPACEEALAQQRQARLNLPISNLDRSTGTLLSSHLTKELGENALPEDSIQLNFKGSAGQSFMAFGVTGITALLKGDANDSLCKGLSGAKVALMPSSSEKIHPVSSVICGNAALYGATSGRLYVRGSAGERFAVRNSGAHAVVEGVGDHGCEYMTGGSVVVLGPVGRNFAAGMSGGRAFIYDPKEESHQRVNTQLVDMQALAGEDDLEFIRQQLSEHLRMTGSLISEQILKNWESEKNNFICITPHGFSPTTATELKHHQPPAREIRPVSHDSHFKPAEIHGGVHG